MYDWSDDDPFVQAILAEIQKLDEIGGPKSLNEYVAILEVVKEDLQTRIDNANKRIANGEQE